MTFHRKSPLLRSFEKTRDFLQCHSRLTCEHHPVVAFRFGPQYPVHFGKTGRDAIVNRHAAARYTGMGAYDGYGNAVTESPARNFPHIGLGPWEKNDFGRSQRESRFVG